MDYDPTMILWLIDYMSSSCPQVSTITHNLKSLITDLGVGIENRTTQQ